ncbi:MAG: Uma2 family endonuclease [Lewinellaceae bacterium]|nr:Uma2 family endonuclease [Phaeodactylibacter sp.]MCB9036375.1 Uma2 family endonuclease [Lewinellaceae bacterium]
MQSVPKDKLYLIYPETDGEPMAENTLQFEWIVLIKLGLEACFTDRYDVFVAGDLFWYPVEGRPDIRLAPDILAVIGRHKGHRGSYMQWVEDHIPPQVVFEILSPGNRSGEMAKKFEFYRRYGVEEYYIYDPHQNKLEGYLREGEQLVAIPEIRQWISPLLGIRFEWTVDTLTLYRPDGERFLSYLELLEFNREAVQKLNKQREQLYEEIKKTQKAQSEALKEKQRAEEEKQKAKKEKQRAKEEKQRAEQEKQRAEQEKQRAEQEKQRADTAEKRAQQMAEKLRQMGIDPDAL